MRLKTFQAATMSEAMDLVRQSLGDDAIIVSSFTHRNGGGVEITAALEQHVEDDFVTSGAQALRFGEGNGRLFVPRDDFSGEDLAGAEQAADVIGAVLAWHGVPSRTAERLTHAVQRVGIDDPVGALAEALDDMYRFPGLSADNRPLIVIGPPGSGKTIAIAKLAARCVMERRPVHVISCDASRAAAGEQLAALCGIMKAPFVEAADAAELERAVEAAPQEAKLLIDTAGINLHAAAERRALKELIQASGAEPVAVFAAGMDAIETGELAAQAVALGARRFIGTRLDAARRLGGLLAAADLGGLAFADAGASPFVGKGFERLDPLALAHRLLADPDAAASGEASFADQTALKPAALKAAE